MSYKLIVKMHCITWYTGTCGITALNLLYTLKCMVKCVCYMGHGFNGCFLTGPALMGNHYKTNIISGVGHQRSYLVMLLVLCIVAYNIWGKVQKHSPNIFFLSETKTQTAYATVILNSLGYFLMSHSPPTGSKGGLLLAWHHGVDLEFF
jgi:hypothetical protein